MKKAKNDSPRDKQVFEILVREHHRSLMGYAISICREEDAAKDIVQDAFVRAWQNIDKFEPKKDFGAWMRGIVRNKAKEWSRRQNLIGMDEEILNLLENQHQTWDNRAEENGVKLLHTLNQCRHKLPQLLSEAITLFYFQGCSGSEAAQKAGADPSTLRKRLERARHQLRECIETAADAPISIQTNKSHGH